MDPDVLAAREHENFVAWLTICAGQVPDALVRVADGIVIAASGLPYTLFNRVVVTDPDATEAGLAAAVATMRARGAPFAVTLRRGIDDRFIESVAADGLAVAPDDPSMPGMVLVQLPTTVPAPPGLEIRQAREPSDLEDHNAALGEGFGIPASYITPIMVAGMLERPDLAIYVGCVDGEPATSGFGVRTGSTIGVYNIATPPRFRGRGFGAAITTRIAVDGAAAGCDVGILQASTMGFPIYERLGYRTVVVYDDYTEPN